MLEQLAGRWQSAETRLLNAGLIEDAIDAYLQCAKWRDAIRVAEAARASGRAAELRSAHLEHLLATGQLEEAGAAREEAGDVQVRAKASSAVSMAGGPVDADAK